MQQYRTLIVIMLLAAVFAPLSAHAAGGLLGELLGSASSTIVQIINSMLDIVMRGLTDAIAWMGGVLQSVLNLPMSYGGATVYQVWRWLRDLCNMLFIVVMVVISFATIFNVIRNSPFYWRQALPPLVIAAITINISMAVGQTIMWSGNKLGTLVLDAMGGGANAAAQIQVSLNIDKVISMGKTTSATLIPPLSNIPTEQINPAQKILIEAWRGQAQGGNQASLGGLQYLDGCLQRNQSTVLQCFTEAQRYVQNTITSGLAQSKLNTGTLAQGVQLYDSIYAKLSNVGNALGSVRAGSSDSLNVTLSSLVSLFILFVTALSLFSIIVFSVAKIPAMWFLLAVSAPAFFSLAIPSGRKTFDTWFKNVIGWSLFAPMYLMVIYIGLFMLKTQGTLVGNITSSTSDLPFLSGLLGTVFFAIIAVFIFTGGAAYVFQFCFSLSPSAGQWFGAIGSRLGVTQQTGFGVNTVASRLGALTGTTALYQAGQARLRQDREDLAARMRRGFPTLMRSEEETLALRKSQMGVRGAGEEYAKLTRKHIEEQTAILAAPQKRKLQALETSLLDPKKTQEERNGISAQIKELKASNIANLRKTMGGSNREAALAAGELLMADGKLSPEEFRTLAQQYSQIGPDALAGFVKRRNEQLMKDVKEKKFTKGEEPKEMAEYLSLIGDAKQANAYIEAAKKGKNKFWALEAGARLNLIMGPDGQPMTTDQVMDKESPTFNSGDMLNMDRYYKERGDPIPPKARQEYQKALLDVKKFSEMMRDADAEQAPRIHTEALDLAQLEANREQLKQQEKVATKIASEIKTRTEKDQERALREDERREKEARRPTQRPPKPPTP